MDDYKKILDFSIKINRENVFYLIDCYENSPIFDEIIEEYNELEKEVYDLIEPAAIYQYGELPASLASDEIQEGTPVIYAFMTVGEKITERASEYFDKGDYLAGMLVNAMADDYLFQLDDAVYKIIKEDCAIRHIGVSKRLEAPLNIPMIGQKVVLDATNAKEEFQIDVTEGFMFTTVKSTCYILVLTQDEKVFLAQHICGECNVVNCKMRKIADIQAESIAVKTVPIKIIERNNKISILECKENENLLEAMIKQGIYISAACGGKGTCGKCKIQVIEGSLGITASDRLKLSEEELKQGIRLACKAYPQEECTLRLTVGDEADFEVVSDFHNDEKRNSEVTEEGYVIAIDIGTTTIAVNLMGIKSKNVLQTYTTINKQRVYGSDVIARMQASNEGKLEELRESIRKDLFEGIQKVIEKENIDKNQIVKVAIAGNTTMGHLLMGYSCKTLGVFPFKPVNIGTIALSLGEALGLADWNIPTEILPGISAFVGGDILAGLLNCDYDQDEDVCLLIDLGTNGEMAIGNKDNILVSSTAAGPAFEGGNISCGIGSIAGAICNIDIRENGIEYETIGQKPPKGICGTGVIEITSELVQAGLVDETGLLDEKYFQDGYEVAKDETETPIIFTQKDIREIQLAKSAIRAGIETLILRYGINYDKIKTVYLAGGFGYKINMEKAIHIGLIPKELSDKIKAIGNSSLGGAVKYLLDQQAPEKVEKILGVSKEINLSNDKAFNDFYMDYMFFEIES